jgi:hypothetical protein
MMTESVATPASPMVYQIPLAWLDAYRGRGLIPRSAHPDALLTRLSAQDLDHLAYVQLCALPRDAHCLIHWAQGLPIELLLEHPAADFARLYQYAKLGDNHPVRVTLPVVPGFENAVRLALSLQFAVRLQIGQPGPRLSGALAELLDDYLRKPSIAQPIEPFHSLLFGRCHREPISLWAIQEEDPALVCYVDDQGVEHMPGKLADADVGPTDSAGSAYVLGHWVERWGEGLLADAAECAECAFFACCRGYFKWPRRDYDCRGVKALFETLWQAADELRADLAAAPAAAPLVLEPKP